MRVLACIWLAGASSLALSGAAAAQGSAASPVAELQEVVVTAQRRAERLEDVPIAVTVASGAQLETAGVTRLEDISRIAPGVQISQFAVFTQPAIRGVTSTLAGSFENNVAVYLDGYYVATSRGLNMDLVNIAQVQVLKGPQGTLFGRNSTGGAILVQTLDPSMTERSGRVQASYLRFNDRRIQAYFSTPIVEGLAWNIAGSFRKSDGYIKDVAGFDAAPIESYDVSTKLRWTPTEKLTLSGKLETSRLSDARSLATTYEGRSQVLADPRFPGTYLETRDNRTSINRIPQVASLISTAAGRIEYDMGFARLSALTSYQRQRDKTAFDRDGTKVRLLESFSPDRTSTYTTDVNLSSPEGGRLQYVVGAYYFKLRHATPEALVQSYPSFGFVNSQSTFNGNKAYALYGDATLEVAPKLFVTGGLRYSEEKFDQTVLNANGTVRFQGRSKFTDTSPRVAIRYQLAERTNVYGSYSKGFRSGFLNNAAPFNVVNPEKLDAFEAGYKTARGRLRFDASAYLYNYKDLQVSVSQIVNNIPTTFSTNAAKARIYGAEAQLQAQVTPELNVNAGIAYTHARYRDFKTAVVNGIGPTGLNISACPNAAPPPATVPCTQDLSGQRLIRAPDWMINLGADYTIESTAGKFLLAGNLAYTSRNVPTRPDLLNGQPRYDQPGYTIVNLRLSWSPPGRENLTLSAVGYNITDARYYIYRTGNTTGDFHTLGTPATWGVQADVRF
jgi:iron complex outermembrane receptor protein